MYILHTFIYGAPYGSGAPYGAPPPFAMAPIGAPGRALFYCYVVYSYGYVHCYYH